MKTNNILVALFFAMLLTLSLTLTSFASVVDSPHNIFRRPQAASQNEEVCIYCHTPHNANVDPADYGPLWNAGVQTRTDFTPYSSATLDAVIGDPLIGPSRLCISCHDGTIAVDIALGGNRRIAPPREIGDGATLASDHPVGFDYIAAAELDNEIRPATASFSTGTIADFLFTSGSGEIMTCATCHDVHEWGPGRSFLYVENDNSALCLACHIK